MLNRKLKKAGESKSQNHSSLAASLSTRFSESQGLQSILLRYGLALALFLVTLGVSLLLSHFEIKINLTILLITVLVVAAWYGGTGPGIVLAVLVLVTAMIRTPISPESSMAKVAFAYFSVCSLLVFVVLLITGRKKVEKRLHDSEETYRHLFENNPLPMWIYDLETLCFLAVNDAATVYYGYSQAEFLSMNIKDIRPPSDVPALLQNVSKSYSRIDNADVWRHQKKDRSIIDVEITSHELTFNGRRSRLVLANDITERKQTERELYKLAAIVESSSDAIISVNLENIIISWNKGAEKVFGYHSAEAVGQNISILYPPETVDKEFKLFAAAQQGKFIEQLETNCLKKDQTPIPVALTLSPIKNVKGEIVGVSGIIRDITERKLANTALRESEYKIPDFA